MSESEFVDVDGGRLFHVRDGEGPAVVLIHGAPTLDHRMWADQVAPLARSHTVVRYDLRGYGRSSLPIDPYRHCDDLASLISGLDLDRAVLGGMSFGAAVGPTCWPRSTRWVGRTRAGTSRTATPARGPRPRRWTGSAKSTFPSLVITGDRDVLDVRMIGDRVADSVRNATRVVLSNVGHSPNMEDPASFNRACLDFLEHLGDN